MKKRMSRFLSGILSVATLSTMISINSASVEGRKFTNFMITVSEACEHNGKLLNNDVSETLTEINIDKFVNTIIYESIGFIKIHLRENSKDFINEFTSRITRAIPVGELSNDQKLDFACTLADTLQEMIHEKESVLSQSTIEQCNFFCYNVRSMSLLIKDISTRSDISDDVKKMCVMDIVHTVKEMTILMNKFNCQYMVNLQKVIHTFAPYEMGVSIRILRRIRSQGLVVKRARECVDKSSEEIMSAKKPRLQ